MKHWKAITLIILVMVVLPIGILFKYTKVEKVKPCDVPDTVIYPHGTGTITCPDKSHNLKFEKDDYVTYIRCSCK